jgi:hypothetical protein
MSTYSDMAKDSGRQFPKDVVWQDFVLPSPTTRKAQPKEGIKKTLRSRPKMKLTHPKTNVN